MKTYNKIKIQEELIRRQQKQNFFLKKEQIKWIE